MRVVLQSLSLVVVICWPFAMWLKTWLPLCPVKHFFSLPVPMCVYVCVIPFTHLEAAYFSELLCWLQSQPDQSSPTLPLSLSSLTSNQHCPVFQSFLSNQFCNSICHFTFLSFQLCFDFSSPFSKLFENITPHTAPPPGLAFSPLFWNLFI